MFSMDEGYTKTLSIAPEGKFPVRRGTPDDPTRFVDAWATLPVGVDRKAPLSDLYAPEVISEIVAGLETADRWGVNEGQLSKASAIINSQLINRLVREFLDAGETVISYVAIRSDEEYREGYQSKKDKLLVRLPFKDASIDKAGVIEILEGSGLGLPDYYDWRSRSGCTFCFFQQKIEWVRLRERHPEAFEEAKRYEKTALEHGSPFTWSQGESLTDLEKPDRQEQIKADHERRLARARARLQANPLRPEASIDLDEVYGGAAKACLTCHK